MYQTVRYLLLLKQLGVIQIVRLLRGGRGSEKTDKNEQLFFELTNFIIIFFHQKFTLVYWFLLKVLQELT